MDVVVGKKIDFFFVFWVVGLLFISNGFNKVIVVIKVDVF